MLEVGEFLFMFEVKSLYRVVFDIVIEDWFGRLKVVGFKV